MKIYSTIKYDALASVVVFLVALPLCLGIALASNAPLFSGVIAGVIGGIVVGIISKSALGVSGPAAGLATIVFAYIAELNGGWPSFLLVVVIAGVIQLIMGFMRLGTIAYYFPSSVIKGMLSGIGLVIIIKQIPHALGYNFDSNNLNFFSKLGSISDFLTPGAILISSVSLSLMIFWEAILTKKHKFFKMVPAPLIAVGLGIIFSYLFIKNILPFSLQDSQLVTIPVFDHPGAIIDNLQFPDFTELNNPRIYVMALVLAVIASLETLLSVEACDKLDSQKRVTPTNLELKAQGIGNIISGLIGGLPITQVIVRSSTNVTFGAKTKLSTIFHGLILLVAVISIPKLLNLIPLSSLACVLLLVGYKLTKPQLFMQMYKLGFEQFLPFVATVVGMLIFDLLTAIGIGMAIAMAYIVINSFLNPFHQIKDQQGKNYQHTFKLAEEVSFINKGKILDMLRKIPDGSTVVIDGSNSKIIHYDIIEVLRDFQVNAQSKNISLKLIGIDQKKSQ